MVIVDFTVVACVAVKFDHVLCPVQFFVSSENGRH